jgi:hypothetical protein
MKRPTSLLKSMPNCANQSGVATISKREVTWLINYVAHLERQLGIAQEYAARHAQLYVSEQDKKFEKIQTK